MSYDPVEETAPEVKQETTLARNFGKVLTRQEREAMNDLSLKVFGRKSYWQKLLKNGEFRPQKTLTKNGQPIEVLRWHPLTVDDVLAKMEEQIKTREEQAKKAAEEAAQQAQGEVNGTEKVENQQSQDGQNDSSPNTEAQ